MVRIDEKTHALLKRSANKEGVSMQDLFKKALEEYRRHRILEQANAAYAAVRENAEEYQTWRDGQAVLESTAMDGLEGEVGIRKGTTRCPLARKAGKSSRAHPAKRRRTDAQAGKEGKR